MSAIARNVMYNMSGKAKYTVAPSIKCANIEIKRKQATYRRRIVRNVRMAEMTVKDVLSAQKVLVEPHIGCPPLVVDVLGLYKCSHSNTG